MAKWFEVDRRGLADIAKRRGVHFIVTEPIQNALDEDVTRVEITLEAVEGRPLVDLTVEDDSPDGFRDLADSYMMFRSSYKLDDPEKRGRFNVGEKLLLAVAQEARITSTTGSVIFGPKGRTTGRKRTEAGSVLTARLRMTRDELADAEAIVRRLIVPHEIEVNFNGTRLPIRHAIGQGDATLGTEVRGEEGGFRFVTRKTELRMYELEEGETAHLYEMGIPIDEIACPWHVDVQQKVPMSLDRGSVRHGYRETVQAAAAEIMAEAMTESESQEPWVAKALEVIDDDEKVRTLTKRRFGEKAVIFDPSNPEANREALNAGYRIVHGGELNKRAWRSVRGAEALQPAGRVFEGGRVRTSPDGVPPIPRGEWTDEMRQAAEVAVAFALHACDVHADVDFFDEGGLGFAAMCGGHRLAFNVGVPEVREMIERPYSNRAEFDALLIHECAHFRVKDHLVKDFYEECCRIGARMYDFVRP